MTDILTFIIGYINDNTIQDGDIVDQTTNFVESGILDSFAILSLIMTLESQYAVKFKPQELADPELRIVASLARMTAEKMTS